MMTNYCLTCDECQQNIIITKIDNLFWISKYYKHTIFLLVITSPTYANHSCLIFFSLVVVVVVVNDDFYYIMFVFLSFFYDQHYH